MSTEDVSSTTYKATDGTFRRFKHCKTVVMAGEWQVKSLTRNVISRSLHLIEPDRAGFLGEEDEAITILERLFEERLPALA